MKLLPLFCFILLTLTRQVFCQSEPDEPVHPLVVLNGSGDGSYPFGHAQQITAPATLNGSKFLMWITIQGPRKITNATSPTATVQMVGQPSKVAAIYGNAKMWYPDQPEPPTYDPPTEMPIGVFFPRQTTAATNDMLKLKLKAKIETGELGNGHENNIFNFLAFTLDWRALDEWSWNREAVEFYTKQTGGRKLAGTGQHLSLSGNNMDYETTSSSPQERTLTLWYKASWGLSDLTTATNPRRAPKMNVSATLDRVVGDSRISSSYTTVKTMLSKLNPVVIREIRFTGDTTSSTYYHELKNDDETIVYSKPQWIDNDENGSPTGTGERNYPFGFTSNSIPQIGGEFKVTNLKNQNLMIKAESSKGVRLEASLAPTGQGNYRLFPRMADNGFTPATGTLPMAEYYDAKDSSAFQLDWYVMLPGLSGWNQIGSTKHTVCITKADPVAALDSRQVTLFTLACKNAKGQTADPNIITGIWSEFADRVVNRVDGGITLSYYRDYAGTETSTIGLIKSRDGQCGAWCHLFVDMLKVHGIDNADEGREIRCKVRTEGFMVKNWQFNSPSGTAPYLYENMKNDPYITSGGYSWASSEVTDLGGVPGQGRNNPKSCFGNHLIVQIGSTYYDPSYGKIYTTPDEMDAGMDGFYRDTTYSFLARQNLTTVPPTIDTEVSNSLDF